MASQYFVRSRGKVTGPFDLASLQKLVRRGVIGRMHEVSSDRNTWVPAGEFAELFAPTAQVVAASPVAAITSTAAQPACSPPPQSRFFYSQGGAAIGPVPLGVLQSLAHNGTLLAADMVWAENAQVATPACQLSQLAAIFTTRAPSSASGRSVPGADAATIQRAAASIARTALATGFTIGIIILVFLNLPIAIVNGRALWCWSAVGESGAGLFTMFCFLFLFAGLTLCIASPLTSGVGRGVLFIAVPGVMALAVSIAALISPMPGRQFLGVVGVFIVPILVTLLAGVCRYRMIDPAAGRACQLVLAILAGVMALVVVAALLAEEGGEGLHGLFAASLATLVLAYAAALAASILGVVAAARDASPRGLCQAAAICGTASVALLAVGVMLVAGGIADFVDVGREIVRAIDGTTVSRSPAAAAVLFAAFRIIAMFLSLACLAGVGILETFASAHGGPQPPRVRRAIPAATLETVGSSGQQARPSRP